MLAHVIALIVLFACDPSKELCWTLPNLPPVSTPTPIALALPTPIHAADYATQVATNTSRISTIEAPITSASTSVNGWLGTGATNVPNANGGDFDTGVTSVGSAFDFAANLGDKVGSMFELARSLTHLANSGFGDFFLFMLLSAIFSGVISILIFAGQVGEMIYNLFDDVMVWITNIIP